MEYRLPERDDEEMLDACVAEHRECGETFIHAGQGIERTDYATWLAQIRRDATDGHGRWGITLTQLCLDGDRLVGLVGIRPELPRDLSERYGDIGYGVRPCERRRGYGTDILRHALDVARGYGLAQVKLGCFKDNLASAATIRKCGGRLVCERDNYEPGRLSQYYVIRL